MDLREDVPVSGAVMAVATVVDHAAIQGQVSAGFEAVRQAFADNLP
jgi:hypothetical protein